MKNFFLIFAAAIGLISMAGCSSTPDFQKNSPYTQGNVQLNIKKGETTQAEVLNIFGAPNIATTDGNGNDVWTYQKNATVSQSGGSSFFVTIILADYRRGSFSSQQSSNTMTLILKFNKDKKVEDFKCMSTSF